MVGACRGVTSGRCFGCCCHPCPRWWAGRPGADEEPEHPGAVTEVHRQVAGLRRRYVLVMIEHRRRRVHLAGITAHPHRRLGHPATADHCADPVGCQKSHRASELRRSTARHDHRRVATPALPDLQPATDLADTAPPRIIVQGHRTPRPAPRGRRTPQNQPKLVENLGGSGGVSGGTPLTCTRVVCSSASRNSPHPLHIARRFRCDRADERFAAGVRDGVRGPGAQRPCLKRRRRRSPRPAPSPRAWRGWILLDVRVPPSVLIKLGRHLQMLRSQRDRDPLTPPVTAMEPNPRRKIEGLQTGPNRPERRPTGSEFWSRP